METFLGKPNSFWIGIETLAVCISALSVSLTLWFIYRQVKIAARTFQLEAIRSMQTIIDSFREDRKNLFFSLPLEISLSQAQFATRPPGRRKIHKQSDGEIRRMALTPDQTAGLIQVSNEAKECAKRVIGRLNDVGQLIEDGFIEREVFLGKYHVLVIQCCHMVEAIRRQEEEARGGNYGQRLLRMRHWAVVYNDCWPKHRDVDVDIVTKKERKCVYHSPTSTILRQVVWGIRRRFSWYT